MDSISAKREAPRLVRPLAATLLSLCLLWLAVACQQSPKPAAEQASAPAAATTATPATTASATAVPTTFEEKLQAAQRLLSEGRVAEAQGLVDQMEGMSGDKTASAGLLFLKARMKIRAGLLDEARKDVEAGFKLVPPPALRVDGLFTRAMLSRAGGDLKGADEDLGGAIKIYEEELKAPLQAAEVLTLRARERTRNKNYDGALADVEKARGVYEKAGQKKLAAASLLLKANIQEASGDVAHALQTLEPAVKYFSSAGVDEPLTLAAAYQARGNLYLKVGALDLALKDLDRAAELASGPAAQPSMAIACLRAEAGAYVLGKKHREAAGALGRALDVYKRAGLDQPVEKARLLAMRGESEARAGMLDAAEKDIDEAAKIASEANEYNVLAQTRIGRGEILYQKKMYEESGAEADEAQAILAKYQGAPILQKEAENLKKKVKAALALEATKKKIREDKEKTPPQK